MPRATRPLGGRNAWARARAALSASPCRSAKLGSARGVHALALLLLRAGTIGTNGLSDSIGGSTGTGTVPPFKPNANSSSAGIASCGRCPTLDLAFVVRGRALYPAFYPGEASDGGISIEGTTRLDGAPYSLLAQSYPCATYAPAATILEDTRSPRGLQLDETESNEECVVDAV